MPRRRSTTPTPRWYAANRAYLEERFAQSIQILPNGCWEWKASRGVGSGYPFLASHKLDRKRLGARPIAWYLSRGDTIPWPEAPWPAVCRNAACVAPEHLVRCSRGEIRYYQGYTVLSPASAADIHRRAARGDESLTAIAEEYGVDQELVSMIAHGKRWTFVTDGVAARRGPARVKPRVKARAVAGVLSGKLSYKSAAAMSGVDRGTVGSWLHRYRRGVQAEWADLVERYLS